jgi:outer membrane protein assembly factor BamB
MKDGVGVISRINRKIAVLLAVLIILSPFQMVTSDSWPTFLHDNENTGLSASLAPLTNDTLWTVPSVGGNGYSSPTIANGRVFINRGQSGKLYSLWANNGNEIWNKTIGNAGHRSSSAAVYQGKVYIVGDSLFCFYENNGTQIWNKPLSGGEVGTSSPTVSDGMVFVFTQILYCFYADNGTEIWNKDMGGPNGLSTPTISGGKVFVNGGNFNYLYCLYANNGTEIWNVSGGGFANNPVIANGKVFYNPSKFYCLYESNGTEIWNRSAAGDGYSTPAVAFDKVYVHTTNRIKCYYQSNGTIVFSVKLEDGSGSSSPSISASGNVYILTTRDFAGGVLYCLNGKTGSVIWSYVTGGVGYSTVAIANETIIVNEGTVYCFGNYAPNTDYILIRDGPNGTGNNLCDPANYLTYPVGKTIALYGAVYNYTAPGDGYIMDAPIFLNWFSGNKSLATVSPSGITSTLTISNVSWGTVVITVDDNEGHLNTTQITISQPTSDYVLIRDQSDGLGDNLCDPSNFPDYPRGFSTTFYGAIYNITAGYLYDILPSSTWDSDNISLVTLSSPGHFSNIQCSNTNFGSAQITLTAGSISNTTTITVLSATIDYVQIRDEPSGAGINLCDPVNYKTYPVGYLTTFYAAAYNGSDFLTDIPVGWSSSNSTIVVVSASGSYTSVITSIISHGNATISIDAGGGITNFTQVIVVPPEIDYILIRNMANGNGINLCDPVNYPSYPVGYSGTYFGARYNISSGYLDEVPVSSTWSSSNDGIVSISSPGISSTIFCNETSFGIVTITLNDGEGHENTTLIRVLEPSVDYLQIRDAPQGSGNISIWDNFTLEVFITKKYYAAIYNFTKGYIGERPVTWTLVVDIGNIQPNFGYSTNFTAEGSQSGTLFANYSHVSNFTVISVYPQPDVISLTPPTRLKVEVISGGLALNLSWDPYSGDNFAGFNIYRSTDVDSGFELININGLVTETSYIDSQLTNGVTYYYYITAVDNSTIPQESDPSLTTSGIPLGEDDKEDEDFPFIILILIVIIILILLLFLVIKKRREPSIISKTFVEMESPINEDELLPKDEEEAKAPDDEELGLIDNEDIPLNEEEDIPINESDLPIFEDEGEFHPPED